MVCGFCWRIGPESRPSSICMIVTPVFASPFTMAHSIGAAPRSSGRSEGWTLIIPWRGSASRSGLRMWPYATTTPTSGARARSAARNSGSAGRAGSNTGTPSARAASFTGDATALERDRPCGWSGRVTAATTSKPSPSRAAREGTANSGVPQKTTRTLELARRLRRDLLQIAGLPLPGLLPLGEQQPALDGAQVVEKQHAVQVVDLVLHGAALEAADSGAVRAALAVQRLEREGEGAFHVAVQVGDRQPPFFGRLPLVTQRDDAGIDQHQRGRVVATHIDDRDAARDAHLVRREPHALQEPRLF